MVSGVAETVVVGVALAEVVGAVVAGVATARKKRWWLRACWPPSLCGP